MSEKRSKKLPQAKSYTSIYDIFGPSPFNNILYKHPNKNDRDQSVIQTTYDTSTRLSANTGNKAKARKRHVLTYMTSEKYNDLNKASSCNVVIPSKSTIFYDLDDVAKRHSFNCLTELNLSNNHFVKVAEVHINNFKGKSNAIVQECATQIHPKLFPRDSIEVSSKKIKKKFPYNTILSSEIYLRDEDYKNAHENSFYYKGNMSERPQKFWSYAKYRTEYTKTIPEEKKAKKKDKGKRTEDPCPCQLFSYACPCTDKKSLTELAKNSKSFTFADEITSTTQMAAVKKDTKHFKFRKQKRDSILEDKPTNTSAVEVTKDTNPNNVPVVQSPNKHDIPILTDANIDKSSIKTKSKSRKKSRRVLCPNCKENVDVLVSVSTTEEEECLKSNRSSVFRNNELPAATTYAFRASPKSKIRSKTVDDGDLCLHEPRCEMLPVCQILPTENVECNRTNFKCTKKHSLQKTAPRIIRITKACRHHPPCTVVPSCQRANVLKNNCEYIPPCLHRPRCVNLPLCVPISKSLYCEDAVSKPIDGDIECAECLHVPRCKYIPVCQHDSLVNGMNHQIDMSSRVQNTCEFLNDLNTPAFLMHPNSTYIPNTYSPYPISSPVCHNVFKCTKSCQFDSSNYKYSGAMEESSNDAVVFIRDVGCQFRNKTYPHKDSTLKSKMSSNSFELDLKSGNYYTNYHTLRYEDKFTNPQEVCSVSTASMSSEEVDSQCPSHGRGVNRCSSRIRTTGFHPKSAYVAAYTTLSDNLRGINKSDIHGFRDGHNTFPVKSRRSFLKGKYRKMFSLKRRRKSRASSHVTSCHSKKPGM